VPKKSKQKSKRSRRPEPDAGLTALALTQRRLDEQASHVDRLHGRRLALLGVLAVALATYALIAALAVTQAHQPTVILALGASLPILGAALVAATAAWPWREPDWIGPSIDQAIAHTPSADPAPKRRRRKRTPKEPPALTEADLRLSVARWNGVRIEANDTQIERLANDTARAARWTLVTTILIGAAVVALGLVRLGRLILEDEPTRSFFVS
jgi:hypothetical protein